MRLVGSIALAAACGLAMAVAAGPAAAESRPVATIDSSTSTACPAPAVRWKMLMRFWPRSKHGARRLPSMRELEAAVTETRNDFIDVSGCVVDIAIDLAPQRDAYRAPAATAHHGARYDTVWDSFAGSAEQTRYCGLANVGYPEHVESPAIGCTSTPYVPFLSLFAHEWWHGAAEHTLPLLGVTRLIPQIHDQGTYGYQPGFGGLIQFWRDMFAGRSSPNGVAQGITRDEWALGTNRVAARRAPLRALTITPDRLRLSRGSGAAIRFKMARRARVRVYIGGDSDGARLRLAKRFTGRGGSNVVRFDGRVAGRRLRPGRYRVVVQVPSGDGLASQVARFRVTRR